MAHALAEITRRWRRLDRLVRLMITNWLVGMGVGVACAALTLAFDFAGLRTLLWRSDMPIAGVAMLTAAFAFTFGGLVCAAAVMMADDDDERGPPRGGRRYRLGQEPRLAFIPIGADVRRGPNVGLPGR